jgi:hypothetical protein
MVLDVMGMGEERIPKKMLRKKWRVNNQGVGPEPDE